MNHLATIQSEFLKESRKWQDLSYDEQKNISLDILEVRDD